MSNLDSNERKITLKMCGILGTVAKDINKKLFQEALKLLEHRGPDNIDCCFMDNVALGHSRLSIIDLSPKGNQPMSDKKKQIFITYNGEIYNFKPLKEELVSKGYEFFSCTDTEVLIHGYLEWGIYGLLDRIKGMFAFCLYDKQKDRLYAARDRMGMKPLYYSLGESSIIFSSEIKSILKLSGECAFDNLSIYTHLFYLRNRMGNRTIFKKVKELLPGELLEYDTVKKVIVKIDGYWDIFKLVKKEEYEKNNQTSLEGTISGINGILEESIQRHLVSDVPVGILYSGGLDSSIVTALAGRAGADLYLFHSEAENFKESTEFARALVDKYHYNLILCKQEEKYLAYLPEHLYHFETVCLRSDFAYSFLCKKARELGVKVLLSGDAADELFGGYDIYKMLYAYSGDTLDAHKHTGLLETLLMSGHSDFNKMKLPLDFVFFAGTRNKRWERCLESYQFVENKSERVTLAYMLENISGNLASKFLHRGDRAGMMSSVEVRIPYLYRPLLEFALNLPFKYKIKAETNEGKYLLRALAAKIGVPDKIINRAKMGMVTSFEKDLHKLLPLFQKAVLRDYLELDNDVFERYLHADASYLWSFLNYEILMRIFLHNEPREQITEEITRLLAKGRRKEK